MADTMRSAAAGSAHRTGEPSMASSSPGVGNARSPTDADPIRTTWERTWIPSSARNALQKYPSPTRVAVSRALARSRMSRASSAPYFCIPARSACPGRGRVSRSDGSGSPNGAIRSRYFCSHSALAIVRAIGAPSVRPWRSPPRTSKASRSRLWRPLRPYPWRRRASSSARALSETGTPAGSPSRIPTRAFPWDSPAVSRRNMGSMIGAGTAPNREGASRGSAQCEGDETQSVNGCEPWEKLAHGALIESSLNWYSIACAGVAKNFVPSMVTTACFDPPCGCWNPSSVRVCPLSWIEAGKFPFDGGGEGAGFGGGGGDGEGEGAGADAAGAGESVTSGLKGSRACRTTGCEWWLLWLEVFVPGDEGDGCGLGPS